MSLEGQGRFFVFVFVFFFLEIAGECLFVFFPSLEIKVFCFLCFFYLNLRGELFLFLKTSYSTPVNLMVKF